MAVEKNRKDEAAKWGGATIIVATFSFMFYALAIVLLDSKKGIGSSEAAGWAQAIGSVAAILAAIWISSEQYRRQLVKEARDRVDGERSYLEAIQAEFDAAATNARNNVGKSLDDLPDGQPFLAINPVAESPLKIFDAQIERLTLVSDPNLRKQIVQTYLNTMSFVQSVRMNNSLVEGYEPIAHQANHGIVAHAIVAQEQAMRRSLVSYAKLMKAEYSSVISALDKLIGDIYAHLSQMQTH